jgi:hypothetical protein
MITTHVDGRNPSPKTSQNSSTIPQSTAGNAGLKKLSRKARKRLAKQQKEAKCKAIGNIATERDIEILKDAYLNSPGYCHIDLSKLSKPTRIAFLKFVNGGAA